MILAYLIYGDVIYGNASQEGLLKLQRLQNKCLKICKGFNARYDTDELHYITKVPMLKLELSSRGHVLNLLRQCVLSSLNMIHFFKTFLWEVY